MIVSVKAGSSIDVGKYLTDRDLAAFTIIEGNAEKFDYLCEKSLIENNRKKISHYSFVLSFKEEHLTKDDLLNYYMQFKEKMFCNYEPSELEILSVIHWDDNKPHIHCVVINSSQIDNNRDLRLFRGYPDFSRVESIQEIINYENDLASVFDSHNLLSLTQEQKRRDWKVKKREVPYYEVFDDVVYKKIDEILKDDMIVSYDRFINEIEKNFGKTVIVNTNKLNKDGFNEANLLKESKLVLTEKFTSKNENYSFNSKLFDKTWFNKNILKIKTALINNINASDIKYKIKKKTYKEQLQTFETTNKKHEEHIFSRKVGKKFTTSNIDKIFETNLEKINRFNLTELNKSIFESQVEKLLFAANKKNLLYFIENLNIKKFKITNDSIEYTKGNQKFSIFNEDLINIYKNKVSSGNKNNSKKLEQELISFLENLKSNKAKAKVRESIEELFYIYKIKNHNEFIELLKKFNIKINKIGFDSQNGNYITIDFNNNKVRLYNDVIYNICKENDDTSYNNKRDIIINDTLKDTFLSNYIKSVYLEINQKNDFINTVNGYRLYKSDDVINCYFSIAKNNDSSDVNSPFTYKNHPYNDYEQVDYKMNTNTFKVHKTLDKTKTANNIADMYHLKGIKNISIDNMDSELLEAFIKRIKEKNYNITIWNESNQLIFINKDLKNDDLLSKVEINSIAKKTHEKLKEEGGIDKIMTYIDKLEKIDINKKNDLELFRKIMKEINKNNRNSLEAICLTQGINIIRVGHDNTKGDYATFEFKGKKISVYDTNVVEHLSELNSNETLLSL